MTHNFLLQSFEALQRMFLRTALCLGVSRCLEELVTESRKLDSKAVSKLSVTVSSLLALESWVAMSLVR